MSKQSSGTKETKTKTEKEQEKEPEIWIQGPISITEHILPDLDKHIYVLGDVHVMKPSCPSIDKTRNVLRIDHFLEWTIQDFTKRFPKGIIDVYVEMGHGVEAAAMESGDYINVLVTQQQACAASKTVKGHHTSTKPSGLSSPLDMHTHWGPSGINTWQWLCTKNVRFHNFDIRGAKSASKWMKAWLLASMKLGLVIGDPELASNVSIVHAMLKEDFVPLILKTKQDYQRVLDENKITKQLSYIPHSGLAKLIQEIFVEDIQLNMAKVVEDIDLLEQLLQESSVSQEAIALLLEQLNTSMTDVQVYFMDAYTLARMFRSWSDRSQPPRYIVLYVGDFHANTYRRFLNFIRSDFKTETVVQAERVEHNDTYSQCLNVSNFRLPLFSSPVDHKIYARRRITETDLKEEHTFVKYKHRPMYRKMLETNHKLLQLKEQIRKLEEEQKSNEKASASSKTKAKSSKKLSKKK